MEVHLAGTALVDGDRRNNGRGQANMIISQLCNTLKPTIGFIS
jgi:hypothetical protein